MFQLANIIGFGDSIFKNEIKNYVIPEINEAYLTEQQRTIEEINRLPGPKAFAGDAQYDSPGFCAENVCYTITDTRTGLAMGICAKNKKLENCSSQALEPMAMEELTNEIIDLGLEIDEFVTDRSKSVTSRMQQKFPHIRHRFDAWHVFKQIKVEFFNVSKTKRNEKLRPFIKGIVNHLWYSLKGARENPEGAREIMLSRLFHLVGKHNWKLGPIYQQLVDHIKSNIDPKSAYQFPEEIVGQLFKVIIFSKYYQSAIFRH